MHLHARRIRIDHPDGSPLDVKADPPSHFAETLASLGFEISEGDLPLEIDIQPTASDRKAADKRAATAYAKDMRKARRGERRSRSESGGPSKPRGGKPSGAKADSSRPSKSGPARPGAGGRSGSGGRPGAGGRPRKPARD